MSAELYDAEMAGALARPAIDVLPAHNGKKDKAADAALLAPAPAPEAEPVAEAPVAEQEAAAVAPLEAADVPATFAETPVEALAVEPVEAPARKVFGMSLTRGRRAKQEPEAAAVAELAADTSELEAPEVPGLEPELPLVAEDTLGDVAVDAAPDEVPVEAPVAEVVAVAPAAPDQTDEVRALQALLEASEQVRLEAEARTAAAEAQTRTTANSVQEWQIRHREAESTISELAASLAGAEGRMAELHQQVAALQTERDDLISQLDTATSPTA